MNNKRTICLPLEINIDTPRPDWKLVNCNHCGKKCYESDIARVAIKQGFGALCTICALTNRA